LVHGVMIGAARDPLNQGNSEIKSTILLRFGWGSTFCTYPHLGFDMQGEFDDLIPQRRQIADALVGRRITVADIFIFADKLQQIYVRAG
jgi:hypothetical protein